MGGEGILGSPQIGEKGASAAVRCDGRKACYH
jgi:hypothetical protein